MTPGTGQQRHHRPAAGRRRPGLRVRLHTILARHGAPTGPEVCEVVRRCLADARELLGDDGDAYKKAIVDRYPAHVGPFIIGIAHRSVFPAGS
ncbi:hypothetical protein [Streptomyces sp. NPDC001348]